jgi:hypothetical protein
MSMNSRFFKRIKKIDKEHLNLIRLFSGTSILLLFSILSHIHYNYLQKVQMN